MMKAHPYSVLLFFLAISFFGCSSGDKGNSETSKVSIDIEKAEFEHLIPEYKKPQVIAQGSVKERIHPPNWWVKMENPVVELLIHGRNVGKGRVTIILLLFMSLN